MPIFEDALLSGFRQIRIQEKNGSRNQSIIHKLSDTIRRQRKRNPNSINFAQTGDPVLESIFRLFDHERYQLSWNRIVLLGCSAGGDVALRTIFRQVRVPHVPIVIAMHHNPGFRFSIRFDMANDTYHRPVTVKDGVPIRGSRIYFLPGDQEIFFNRSGKTFKTASRVGEMKFRPNIDNVFAGFAKEFKNQCMGGILTGMLYDGAEGAKALSLNHGEVWIQDPVTAMFSDMPKAAKKTVPLARIGELSQIAARINAISRISLVLLPMTLFARN